MSWNQKVLKKGRNTNRINKMELITFILPISLILLTTISFGKPIATYPSIKEVGGASPLIHPLELFRQLHEQISDHDHNYNKSWIALARKYKIYVWLTSVDGPGALKFLIAGADEGSASPSLSHSNLSLSLVQLALWHELSTTRLILKADNQKSNYRE